MGGSVNQKLLGYSQKESVTLITGTNLPVLMQVMMADDDVTEEEIQEFIDDAREELQMVNLDGGKKAASKDSIAENNAPIAENAAQESAKKSAPAPQSYDNSTAKITALRVDDRLIHGQVAMTWTKQLAVQGIVVANDEVANDNTQKMALKMAVPGGSNPDQTGGRSHSYLKQSEGIQNADSGSYKNCKRCPENKTECWRDRIS